MRMPRPLTSAERARIENAVARVEDATLARDQAIADAYNARAQVKEIADAAGLSRNSIYALLKRLARD